MIFLPAAKVILYSREHSRSEYHAAKSRISLHSNTTRRKANITEKSNCKTQLLFSLSNNPKFQARFRVMSFVLAKMYIVQLKHCIGESILLNSFSTNPPMHGVYRIAYFSRLRILVQLSLSSVQIYLAYADVQPNLTIYLTDQILVFGA